MIYNVIPKSDIRAVNLKIFLDLRVPIILEKRVVKVVSNRLECLPYCFGTLPSIIVSETSRYMIDRIIRLKLLKNLLCKILTERASQI